MTRPRIDAGGFHLLTLSSAQKLGFEGTSGAAGSGLGAVVLHRDVLSDTERSVRDNS